MSRHCSKQLLTDRLIILIRRKMPLQGRQEFGPDEKTGLSVVSILLKIFYSMATEQSP